MLEKFLSKDSAGNWNTIPPVSDKQKEDINCHKFVLYAISNITRDELVSDATAQKKSGQDFTFGKKALAISQKEFTLIADPKHLRDFADKNCAQGVVYVGQILDAETGEAAHSFLMDKMSDGTYKCADKAGFKYPFAVYSLEDLFKFENYHNQKWRFIPLDDLTV